ncbi:MAG: GntR family transcriptional regulator [Rhizobiales bacterium]|nr:GntR family transcriptional regulator [Hyphomicrobiales bacterium]
MNGKLKLTPAARPVPTKKLRIEEVPRTLRELALEKMRAAIVEFHFRPGQRLVERDLCEQLGVSRSVVREVIRHLEAEGLVHTVPHSGPIVAKLDAETAAQIYELRSLLESAAAQAAATHASADDIARMGAALDAIGAAYRQKDFHNVLAATNSFYEVMFLCAGKSVAWEMVQRLNGRISWLRSLTVSSVDRGATGPVQMRKILNAITERDGAAAAAACRDHLATAGQIAQRLIAAETIAAG